MKEFKLWEPEVQPDILNHNGSFGNIEWNYPTFIENIYEPLRKKYPDYITRHSTTDVVLGAYLLPYSNGMPESIAAKLKSINSRLYEKHPTQIKHLFMGEEKDYPTGSLTTTYNSGITSRFGIYALTTEHKDYIYDKKLGTSLTMTLSVELLANHLLQICEDDEFTNLRNR